jgi:hypothetical protein
MRKSDIADAGARAGTVDADQLQVGILDEDELIAVSKPL